MSPFPWIRLCQLFLQRQIGFLPLCRQTHVTGAQLATAAGFLRRATPIDFFHLPSQLSSRTAAWFARHILPAFLFSVTAPVTPHDVSGGIFPYRVPRLHPT
ncbi:MAG: hypothetical protein OXF56_18270 [Rhodobacteraceae bacterium]|nr:hypothetical protein [Paracoccaceae bacterium]